MTKARVEQVYEDRLEARSFLVQAERFRMDADAELSAESRAVLLHNASVSASDAILRAAGLRVTSGDGAHQLRLETALDELGQDTGELMERLDASRWARNEASYAAMAVAGATIEEAREATAELIALATEFVGTE
ncbi:MAG TPA: hypothetical protein VID48_06850 [Solirubrobacteraceae bacterium]|jgi:hypothetical protein